MFAGSQARYTHWASGQPGILGGLEDCVAMDVDDQGVWHDYVCEDILFVHGDHRFVCEYRECLLSLPSAPPQTSVRTP